MPASASAIRCRIMPYWVKAAPHAAPLARRQRRALPLGGPPGARRATLKHGHKSSRLSWQGVRGQRTAIFLAERLSQPAKARLC